MTEQIILAQTQKPVSSAVYYNHEHNKPPLFNFPFEAPHRIKDEVALHSIYFPKIEIPIQYRIYFIWNSNLHGALIKLPRAVITTGDIISHLYNSLEQYFKNNYPEEWKDWVHRVAERDNGRWAIEYWGDGLGVNIDELAIRLITSEEELQETKRISHNSSETYHFMEPSISDLIYTSGGYIKKVTHDNQDFAQYEISFDTNHVVKVPCQSTTSAFVKCNLIESSLHNNQWEQIMEVAVLNGEKSHNKVEFNNLTFHKTTVESTIEIVMRLETLDGDFIPFDNASPIVFKLVFR